VQALAAALVAWVLAGAVYAALRVNFERTPVIHVRWSAGTEESARHALEKQFGLADGTFQSGETWAYLLTTPAPANIQALVQSPAVEDTHHIDRQQFRISSSAPRRGPYITSGPAWLPGALRALTAALLIAGLAALAFALRPAAARHLAGLSIAATFGSVWIAYVVQLREGAIDAAGFRVGDWLVSYETGFVRRGLLGRPILDAAAALGTGPESIVLGIQAALYALLFALLFVLIIRRRPTVWFLAFLFSPAALLFPLYDEAVIGRKDVLFLVAFALYAWWMPRPDKPWTSAASCALGAATTLAHEMFFFFTPYVFVMRAVQAKSAGWLRFAPELSLFGGALVALLLVVLLGAQLHGEEQCAALIARGLDEDLCTGIMRYPVTTVGASMRETAAMISQHGYLWAYPIAAALAALPLVPLFAFAVAPAPRAAVVGILSAFAFTLPLFVLVLDWGRLLNLHVIAVAVVMTAFLIEREKAGGFFGRTPAWGRVVIVLMIALYLTGWSVRHCCEAPLRAGLFS
jgi:hypothetical protein